MKSIQKNKRVNIRDLEDYMAHELQKEEYKYIRFHYNFPIRTYSEFYTLEVSYSIIDKTTWIRFISYTNGIEITMLYPDSGFARFEVSLRFKGKKIKFYDSGSHDGVKTLIKDTTLNTEAMKTISSFLEKLKLANDKQNKEDLENIEAWKKSILKQTV